jgi:hypothetical protein
MNLITIAIVVGLIVFVLGRRVKGQAVTAPKKLFLLPLVVSFIGLQNVTHSKMNTVDITVVVAGAVLSFTLGLLRGHTDKLSMVGQSPWVRWSAASVALFALNVLTKLALDAGGVAAGGHVPALTSSILLSFGLTLLAETVVIWIRTQSGTAEGAPRKAQYRETVLQWGRAAAWPPIR